MTKIGSVSIGNVTGSAIIKFGNTDVISPISPSKTNAGSGGLNTGALIVTISGSSQVTGSNTGHAG